MFLEKWYGDFANNREVQIRYLANLRLGRVTIGYRGKLGKNRSSETVINRRGFRMPTIQGESLYWPVDAHEPVLIWTDVRDQSRSLWQEGGKLVTWNPVVSNGEVLVDQKRQQMRGYAERLTLNFPPWHLGLRTLKWGRFVGQRHGLSWIEWLGRVPMKLAILDGKTVILRSIEKDRVETENARLLIGTPDKIVNESLGAGALKAFGWMRLIDRSGFLLGIEKKWFAEGCLRLSGQNDDSGMVVYEEVIWP